ncbi:hypothetical+protein [Methylocapsa aurea]|uniref:DUF1398 domain-containing protein n=1 Tax=Methylocapsa aurea TaxID=663610 RepID=UPI003D189003
MNALLSDIAESCLRAAESDGMAFPEIVGRLMNAGFESYAIDFRRATATYYLPDGDSLILPAHLHRAPIAPSLNAAALREAIREAQQSAPGYTYRGFCEKAMAGGCCGYVVSFSGRRAVYFGRDAETHVECFPQR